MFEIADLDRAVALRKVNFITEGLSKLSNSYFSADDVNTFSSLLDCRLTDCLYWCSHCSIHIDIDYFIFKVYPSDESIYRIIDIISSSISYRYSINQHSFHENN